MSTNWTDDTHLHNTAAQNDNVEAQSGDVRDAYKGVNCAWLLLACVLATAALGTWGWAVWGMVTA